MDDLARMLDKIKESRSIASDNALSARIGVTRAAVSSWRNGRNLPGPVQCARIAELSGEPLARVLGIVGEARAISREEKAVWRKLAAAAAMVVIGTGTGAAGADLAARQSGDEAPRQIAQSIHYV
ncbi:MAG: DUF3693 domain-containing protein [Lysobacteraceae bacterium]